MISILITTFQRPALLNWNLFSLARQNLPPAEIIVLNDGLPDETEAVCASYRDRLNIKYVFTGQRNLSGSIIYRVPGFVINIGAKLASGDILVMSCAEMFHLNETISQLIVPVSLDRKYLGTAVGMDDDGSFLSYITSNQGSFDLDAYLNDYPRLNTTLPFLMAMAREEFFGIGGYDEDLTGLAYDDNDFMGRLIDNGCRLCLTQAQTIHLYHPRHDDGKYQEPEYVYNDRLYRERRGQIVRNLNREWGRLET